MKKNLKSQNVILNSWSQVATLNKGEVVTNCDHLQKRILTVRGTQVMLDRDLAELYGVETRVLNQAVKRNKERFPELFMFRLTKEERENLKSQIVTSSCVDIKGAANLRSQFVISSYGGDRQLPYVFTEQGVAMLSAVLRTPTAVRTSIDIINAFVAMRKFMMASAGVLQRLGAIEIKQLETDKKIDTVFDALDRGSLLPQGIFGPEAEFDALRFVTRLVESARKEIVLIDPYADSSTLEVLARKSRV